MNVLVTGGLGHIGSKLIRDLSEASAKVSRSSARKDGRYTSFLTESCYRNVDKIRIFDNFHTQRYCSLFNLPKAKYEFVEGDIRDKKAVKEAVKGMDLVFHLAAITNAPETFKDPALTKEVNLDGTKVVLDAAVAGGVEKFIYPSTTSVYGPTDGIARENVSPEDYKPGSPYAEYKLAGEKEVLRAFEKEGLDSVVLRLGTIYGPSVGMRFHTAVNKFVFLACLGRPLTVWEEAIDQKRPYLDVVDSIGAFVFFMKKGKGSGQIYNVVTENATVRQVVDTIKEFIPNLQIEYTKSPLLNQMSYFTDDSKIKKLGFKYRGNMKDGIHKTVELLQGVVVR